MKKLPVVVPAMFVLIATAIAPAASANRLAPEQIYFHPTLLNETLAEAQPLQTDADIQIQKPAIADPADLQPPADSQTIALYKQKIALLEDQQGPYDAALSEQHLALATEYLQSGNPQQALNSLQSALQIQRMQAGLYSLEQVPTLRHMINAYVALNDLSSAHQLQEAMLQLRLRHYGHGRQEGALALLDWADWNVNLYLSADLLNDASLKVSSRQGTSTMSYSNAYIQEAYSQYVSALETLHRQSDPLNENLLTTERKLAALNFMVNQSMQQRLGYSPATNSTGNSKADPAADKLRNFHFLNGSSALKRALAYGYLTPQPEHDYIAARMLELADWYLLFDRRGAALDLYQETLDLLSSANIPQQEIDQLYAAGLPVQSPDSTYRSALEPEEFAGYIDVEFTLNKFGSASDPRLLAESEADPVVIRELMRTIRACKFRPKFAAGNVVNKETVKLRYFYKLS